jgi:transposase
MTKRKAPEDLLKVGRPSLYKPEYCDKVIAFGKEGRSLTQMASRLDVDRETLNYWADHYPDFSAALTRAKVHAQNWWEDKGQDGLADRNFNAPLWHKNVASRFREDYADRKEVTGANGGPIQQSVTLRTLDVSDLDDEQLEALEIALLSTMGGDGKD